MPRKFSSLQKGSMSAFQPDNDIKDMRGLSLKAFQPS